MPARASHLGPEAPAPALCLGLLPPVPRNRRWRSREGGLGWGAVGVGGTPEPPCWGDACWMTVLLLTKSITCQPLMPLDCYETLSGAVVITPFKDLETESPAHSLTLTVRAELQQWQRLLHAGGALTEAGTGSRGRAVGQGRTGASSGRLLRASPGHAAAGPCADQRVLQPQPGGLAQGSRCPDHADLGPKAAAAPSWPRALGSMPSFAEAPFHPSQ